MDQIKKWRWATWLVAGWTAFILVVMAVVIYPNAPDRDLSDPFSEASSAYQMGAAFGEALVYWILGMLLFGPIWYFTKPKVRCPVCANKVDPKAMICLRCGYTPAGLQPGYQAPWPPAAQPMWPPAPQPNPFGQQPAWPPQPAQPMWPPPPQGAWPPQPAQPGWPPQPAQPGWPPQPQGAWPPPPPPPPPVPNQLSDTAAPPPSPTEE